MNLLPFDYEEAKKDPTRVRHMCGDEARWVEFVRDLIVLQWCGGSHSLVLDKSDFQFLRLTPKPPETVKVWFFKDDKFAPWQVRGSPARGWLYIRGPVEVTVPEE